MTRLIDADALIDFLDVGHLRHPSDLCFSEVDVANLLLHAPTISPDEVRGVGEWIRIPGFHLDHEYYPARYQCDQCKHFVDSGDDRNYCPNCGAKMEVSEDTRKN